MSSVGSRHCPTPLNLALNIESDSRFQYRIGSKGRAKTVLTHFRRGFRSPHSHTHRHWTVPEIGRYGSFGQQSLDMSCATQPPVDKRPVDATDHEPCFSSSRTSGSPAHEIASARCRKGWRIRSLCRQEVRFGSDAGSPVMGISIGSGRQTSRGRDSPVRAGEVRHLNFRCPSI
jgi:hypothetical protein